MSSFMFLETERVLGHDVFLNLGAPAVDGHRAAEEIGGDRPEGMRRPDQGVVVVPEQRAGLVAQRIGATGLHQQLGDALGDLGAADLDEGRLARSRRSRVWKV